jgi:hypothetical protein
MKDFLSRHTYICWSYFYFDEEIYDAYFNSERHQKNKTLAKEHAGPNYDFQLVKITCDQYAGPIRHRRKVAGK